ncbi:MAG: IclR family transcriptional regulator [Dehalococcoidia bacterium]|nr:MAG: IclR family transcriptional regulator [Dehalococcoidia bacterium]
MSSVAARPPRRQARLGRAFQRYLALLEALASAPPGASSRELARRAGLAPATAHRLLQELLALGVVYDDPASRRYALGARLWVVFDQFTRRDLLRLMALPVMQELRDRTGETVTLVTAFGRERVCILQAESRHAAHFAAALDTPDRLEAGAPGKVLLAFLPPPAQEAYLEGVEEERGTAAVTALRQLCQRVRQQGYLIGRAERAPEFNVISVPVRGPAGLVAALSVVGPASRWTVARMEEALPAVQAAAAAIARACGQR